jgi:Raf kinase inhibitor-like YbhB/YbcL family protein
MRGIDVPGMIAAVGMAIGMSAEAQQDPTMLRSKLQITSFAFKANGQIPPKYTCDGQNVNPPLTFASIPPKTRTLVLIIDDPDVPKNLIPSGVFDHWLIWDLPADIHGIAEGAPEAKRGLNTKGAGYVGPCPPDREHRYFFKLYALDTELARAQISNKQELQAAMKGHVLDQAELMGRYARTGR